MGLNDPGACPAGSIKRALIGSEGVPPETVNELASLREGFLKSRKQEKWTYSFGNEAVVLFCGESHRLFEESHMTAKRLKN